jgi:PPOX class probable F420-dependent enzyme
MFQLTATQVDFLNRQRVAHLATVDDADRPHLVPICFACLDGLVYSAIDEKPKRVAPGALRRLRNLEANRNVCLLVDHYDEDWTQLAWLQVRGLAEAVADVRERSRALAALRERYPQYRSMDLESTPLLRITPLQVIQWTAQPVARSE